MFKSIDELVSQATQAGAPISRVMIDSEMEQSGKTERQLREGMAASLEVMKAAARKGLQGVASHSGMTGGDARRLMAYLEKGQALTCGTFVRALACAVATNEVNASMGVICATPTAGSCGVLPGVLLAVQEKLRAPDEALVDALFCAGAIGYVIANNAMISGAAGGCQAEVGAASAMAAAAAVELAGGSPEQCAQAMAIAMKPARIGSMKPKATPPIWLSTAATGVIEPKLARTTSEALLISIASPSIW